MTLAEALDKYNALFFWNQEDKIWCLSSRNTVTNYWETDDYEADTEEQATNDAIDYLETYNEEA